jgi:serine/threonine-protein kinase BUR1
MVTPYMEHDLSGLLDNPEIHVTEPQRKCYMQQLLRGLMYLHNVRNPSSGIRISN